MKTTTYLIYIICLISAAFTSLPSCHNYRDSMDYYGDSVDKFDGMSRNEIETILGTPDTVMNYDYCECFDDSGRQILPLYYRYIDHLDCVFSQVVWRNVEGSRENLILYFEKVFTDSIPDYYAFWGIRCRPEQFDSVMGLYTDSFDKPIISSKVDK